MKVWGREFGAGVIVVACLSGCGGGGSSDTVIPGFSTPDKSVTIRFNAVVGNEIAACNTDYELVGTAGSTIQFKDFRLFVTRIRLVTSGGEEVPVALDTTDWQAQDVALLDYEDATGLCTGTQEINGSVTGTVPDNGQTFNAIRFTVGVPESINHTEQNSVSPFNVTNMNWGWTNGYKFMRIDIPDWNMHLGATGCAANAQSVVECTNSNRPEIELFGFDPDLNAVQLDYAALVQESNVSANINGAAGCMSGVDDTDCVEIFTQLGLNLASGENDNVLSQTVFSVAP
ncbi:MbnP family copper-binding protein [Ketobacter sp.]